MNRNVSIVAAVLFLVTGILIGSFVVSPARAAVSPVVVACMEANGTTYSPASASRRLVTVLPTQCTYALSKDKFGNTPFTAFYQ